MITLKNIMSNMNLDDEAEMGIINSEIACLKSRAEQKDLFLALTFVLDFREKKQMTSILPFWQASSASSIYLLTSQQLVQQALLIS